MYMLVLIPGLLMYSPPPKCQRCCTRMLPSQYQLQDHWRTCEFLNKKKLLCMCMIPCTHSCDWKSICQTRNCDSFLSSRLVLFCAHYTWFGIINKRKICLLVKNFVCLAQGKIDLYLCWLSVTATKKEAFKHSY